MIPRFYQSEAFESVLNSLRQGNHPCVQLPTGTGKALVISMLADHMRQRNGNVWVLTHVKELVEQNYKTLDRYAGVQHTGIICAGLNRYDEGAYLTYATVQSIHKRALAGQLRAPDAIIIDEAHRVPPGKDGKWYNEILHAYPNARRIGMTATPWRMDGGVIYGNYEGAWFNNLAYEKSVKDMVELGYLSPLIGVHTEIQLDLSGVDKNGGEYVQKQVGDRLVDDWLRAAARTVGQVAAQRKFIAVYCPTVESAHNTARAFESELGWSAGVVVGDTRGRQNIINDWKCGNLRVLCSVDVLTTGFDHPPLDCLVCFRPTESTSLWVQILGRATRIHDGKKNGLVLDFVGNLTRLGGVGMMEKFYEEKDGNVTGTKKATGTKEKKVKKPPNLLGVADPMGGSAKAIKVTTTDVSYVIIPSRTRPGCDNLMVSYEAVTDEGYLLTATLFLCPEYAGSARNEAERWFARRGVSCPKTAQGARYACYSLPMPRELVVKRVGKYINVMEEIM